MISTGNKDLDEFINYNNEITCFYGEHATGKSLLCLLAAIGQLKQNKKVIFLNIGNSFSLERLKQIAGEDYKNLLDNLLLFKIKYFKDQQLKIKSLEKLIEKSKASLVVVDCLVFFYRRMVKTRKELSNGMLKSQMRYLKEISEKVPVLITDEVYTLLKNKSIEPIGGRLIKDNCKLIKLEKEPWKMIVDEKEFLFKIVEKGIKSV